MTHPKVFISYSWDSEQHKDWVSALTTELRRVGIDAEIDRHITQKETVNLDRMMIEKIRDADFTIIVLTENYAQKAEDFSGGVGYETNLLIKYITGNLNKIIPILRGNNRNASIPFYLQGVNYVDFSNDIEFETAIIELQHRIFGKDQIQVEPLGSIPDLPSKSIDMGTVLRNRAVEEIIPDLREITDIDKRKFLNESYNSIIRDLSHFSELTKKKNPVFDFEVDTITSKKSIFRFYINGNEVYAAKIWLGNNLGSRMENIMISYGSFLSESDNSMNEIISCEVKDNQISLNPMMSFTTSYEGDDAQSIAISIWKSIVQYIK